MSSSPLSGVRHQRHIVRAVVAVAAATSFSAAFADPAVLNVADGTVAPGSTEAINGGQAYQIQNTAQLAQSTAEGAMGLASAAYSDSGKAQRTAESARDLAGTALGVANTANNAAGAAQNSANQAQSTADAAQQSANAAQSTASNQCFFMGRLLALFSP